MSTVPAYGERYWLLFGFLFLVDLDWQWSPRSVVSELLHLGAASLHRAGVLVWLKTLRARRGRWCWRSSPGFVAVLSGDPANIAASIWSFEPRSTRRLSPLRLLLVVFPILAGSNRRRHRRSLVRVLFALMIAIAIHA